VLPFVDMSEKKDQEYFSDGLSEEVLDLLSRIPELHVAAQTSAFSFKGKSDDIPTIAKKLFVANVLEGSVRKSGNHLRITAQLVRADNGYHLWSQTYDRKLDDIFKVQDDIAGSVVQALKVSLLQGAMPKATGTQNTEAYTLFLQAHAMHTNTKADYEKIADYLQQAIKLDPTFAPAWAALSALRADQTGLGWYGQGKTGWEEARQAAERALTLDPRLPYAHTAMGRVRLGYYWDWEGAQAQFEQALALDPGNAWALWMTGHLAHIMGQQDKALALMQRVIAIDPINSDRYYALAKTLLDLGKLDEALVAIRKMHDLDPTRLWAHWLPGQVMLEKGNPVEALAEFERESNEMRRLMGRAVAYHALGHKKESDTALAELEKKYNGPDAFQIAEVYAYRGEIDEAFAWLDRAYRQHDGGCRFVKVEVLLKNLRTDPRYKAFLRKMNLPE
jgi:TolB-like protein/cytochrome c-type biogenesis protein CcmH/NrfG